MLGICCCMGFSLVVTSSHYSLAVVRRLLIMVVSLVAERRLQSAQASVVVAPGLWNTGSVVVVHRFSCFIQYESFVTNLGIIWLSIRVRPQISVIVSLEIIIY